MAVKRGLGTDAGLARAVVRLEIVRTMIRTKPMRDRSQPTRGLALFVFHALEQDFVRDPLFDFFQDLFHGLLLTILQNLFADFILELGKRNDTGFLAFDHTDDVKTQVRFDDVA